jgi:amidase
VLIKDNIEAIGLPATAGSLALAGRTVTADATLVTRLRRAGAVVLGSTNLSEWANIRSPQSSSGWSAVGGLTRNPWQPRYSAGGSSAGSGAALAAGLAPLTVGTETDGSIICPASLNGVVGIKPTVGVISTRGVVPISASQDSPGPMARSVADAAALLDVLADLDTSSAVHDTGPLRVGVVRQWVSEPAAAVFESALSLMSRAGLALVEVDVPAPDDTVGADELTVLLCELLADLDDYLSTRQGEGVRSLADVVAFNHQHSDAELTHFGQEFLERALASGGRGDAFHQARARNVDWAINQVLSPALHNVDVLVGCPYGPAWPITLGAGDDFRHATWMTQAPAVAGWPIGCLPMGMVDADGVSLPVGIGVAARAHDEVGLVRAMAAIERTLPPIR